MERGAWRPHGGEGRMKHDPSQAHRHRRERRTRKQEDAVTTRIIASLGAGELSDWQDDVEGWRDELGEQEDR